METKRTPQLIDIILEDHRKASEEISDMMEALIREAREALGETTLEDTGFRRREFRDRQA